MTDQYNVLRSYIEDESQLARRYQNVLIRQVEGAHERGRMKSDMYLYFLSQVCEVNTRNEIFDHFEVVFNELAEYHENQLQERIIRGAEFIDSIGPEHPQYKAAIQKYNLLCEQLQQGKKRANERGCRVRTALRGVR